MKKHYFRFFLLFCLTAVLVSPTFAENLSDISKVTPSFVSSMSIPSVSLPMSIPPTCTVVPVVNTEVCVGGTLYLSTSDPTVGAHKWKGPNNYSSNLSSPNINNVSTARAGVYTVSRTINNCVATATVNVVVNTAPTSLSASSNSPVTHGGTLNLFANASPAGGGNNYYWYGPSSFYSNAQNPSIPSTDAGNNSGIYEVYYGNNACGYLYQTVSVSIIPTCTINNITVPAAACAGSPITLTANVSSSGPNQPGGKVFTLTGPGGFYSTSTSPTPPNNGNGTMTVSPYQDGVYTLTYQRGNCVATRTTSITVKTATLSISSPSNPIVCIGSPYTLSFTVGGSGGGTGTAWIYLPGIGWNTQTLSNGSSSITIPAVSTANEGYYNIYFIKNGCASTTYGDYISVPHLDPYAIALNNSGSFFTGTPVKLFANPSISANKDKFKWAGPSFSSILKEPTVSSVVNSSTYSVSATLTNSCTATAQVYIPIVTTVQAWVSNSTVCRGSSVTFYSSVAPVGAHKWAGPGFSSNLAQPTFNNIQLGNSGIYTLSVTSGNIIATSTVAVTVIDCGAPRLATSDDAQSIDMQINAYPNPVTNTLKVEVELKEAGPLSLQLFNSMGQPSGKWQLNNETTVHQTELDLTSLQGGVYMLQAQSGKEKAVKRVIKIQY